MDISPSFGGDCIVMTWFIAPRRAFELLAFRHGTPHSEFECPELDPQRAAAAGLVKVLEEYDPEQKCK